MSATSFSLFRPSQTGSNGTASRLDGFRAFPRLFWIDLRRSQGYWLLPLMIGLGIYAPSADTGQPVVLWQHMSRAVLESVVILVPLAAALAAWLIDRDRRRRADDLVSTLPGSGVVRDLLAGLTAGCWGLLGYAGVAAWFFGKAIRANAWGGPDLGLVVAGALGIMALAMTGALVGRLVPGRFSPLATLATCWALLVGADVYATSRPGVGEVHPFQLLSPFGLARRAGEVDGVFARHTQSMVPQALVWFVALMAALAFVLVVWRNRHWVNVIVLVAAVVLMVLAARPLVDAAGQGFSFERVEAVPYTPICDESGSYRVCLHPAYGSLLSSTVVEVNEVLGPVAGLEGVPHTLVQRGSLLPDLNPGEGVLDSVGYPMATLGVIGELFAAPDETPGWSQFAASQIVIQAWLAERSGMPMYGRSGLELFGFPAEVRQMWIEDEGNRWSQPENAAQAEAVYDEMEAVLARFSALSETEQRTWLEANWDALRMGEIALEDMP